MRRPPLIDLTETEPDPLRTRLSALRLKPVSGPMVDAASSSASGGRVFDLAVYRATGDRRLAALFGTAA